MMLGSSTLATLAHLAMVSVALGQDVLAKPAAWPNLDQFGPTINTLPATRYTITPWASGTISRACRNRVVLDGRDPTTFKSYTVSLDDCSLPWYVCREDGAEPSLEGLVDKFARVPIGLRQYIGDAVHFKGEGGATAWLNSIVHMSGSAANSVGIWIHEASHCVDGANEMGITNTEVSWRSAYERDSHVADNYARTNHVENFAQYAGLVIYDSMTNGKLRELPQYNWILYQFNRMAVAAEFSGDGMFDYSGTRTCRRRWGLSPSVDAATGTILSRRDFITPRNTGLRIVPLREDLVETPTTNCTLEGERF